ncbi:MAG: hypothetical protein Q4C72_03475 [Eubacteriales bacterium]|nr:hypothetical protein [Eubacteriales bacterium]
MPDQNEILRRFAAQAGNEQTIEQLRAALNTPDGRKAAQVISAQHAADLERAAAAAQRGDMGEAARLAQKLMQTHEGSNLAAQLKKMFLK